MARGVAYILQQQKPDGGIHSGVLENYNTALCLSALARLKSDERVAEAVAKAQDFLRNLQWHGQVAPDGKSVDEAHPFFGGAGYGSHGRPDLSNTQIMLQGLYDSDVDCNDPAFQHALVFIARCQGVASNEQFKTAIQQDGGFIYATSVDKDHIGVPQSFASPESIDAAKAGQQISGLATYGSMTYAGFKSYVYAQLDRNDPRVQAVWQWIERNYTFDRNPGMPEPIQHHGQFYYYMTAGKALRGWGSSAVTTPDGQQHDWANDLVAALIARQRPDWVLGQRSRPLDGGLRQSCDDVRPDGPRRGDPSVKLRRDRYPMREPVTMTDKT